MWGAAVPTAPAGPRDDPMIDGSGPGSSVTAAPGSSTASGRPTFLDGGSLEGCAHLPDDVHEVPRGVGRVGPRHVGHRAQRAGVGERAEPLVDLPAAPASGGRCRRRSPRTAPCRRASGTARPARSARRRRRGATGPTNRHRPRSARPSPPTPPAASRPRTPCARAPAVVVHEHELVVDARRARSRRPGRRGRRACPGRPAGSRSTR